MPALCTVDLCQDPEASGSLAWYPLARQTLDPPKGLVTTAYTFGDIPHN